MKVNVLQVSDATFRRRFSWWSQWIDIAVFDYASTPHLIQMRVSRANGKSFRSIDMTGWGTKLCNTREVGDLTPMRRETTC
jgi:hypothetical protein